VATEVYNSRSTKFDNQIWRRRRCSRCHKTFTTYESTDLSFLKVRSANRSLHYSKPVLYASISAAFPSRTRESVVDAITSTVEAKLLDLQQAELSATDISKCVLTTLKAYDQAAFLRYLADHAELTSNTNLRKHLKEY
jgi:transcriptional repressor NrdR